MKNKSQAFVNLRKKLSLLILLITVVSTSSFTTTTIKSSLENKNTCFVEEENINNIKEAVFRNSLEENAMPPATFTSLGAADSGGPGFKTTNFPELVVSNNLTIEGGELYGSNSDYNNVETLIFKADEVDAASFDLYDMTIYSFGAQSDYSGTSLTLKDKDGNIIKTMTGVTSLGQTEISIGSFFTTNNSLPVIGVAEIIIEVHNSSPDNFTITSIDFRNTVAPSSNTTPTVTTTAASGITATTATLGGNITDNGGATVTERGIVYNTTGTPTTANTKVQIGSGDGSFSGEITGLTANTEYYVRAYAINSESTSYGSEESFTTPACTMTASITSQTNVACYGNSTGSLTVTPANGASPYTYLWNDGSAQTTATASGLSAGNYEVTVTDNNGCTATASATITQPTALSTSITATPVSYNGGNDGTIDLTVTGGTTPYGFDWSHTATTEDLTGLTAGTYNVKVTDVNGCTITTSAEVTEPAPFIPDANNILYVDKDATGIGSGNSWENAITELADALVWAKINEDANWENTPLKIYVSIGTYKPLYSPKDSNFGTDQERDNSFLMVKNVQVYGGFDPSNNINTLNDERILPSTGTNGTILSADVNNDDGDDFTNNSENLTRVIVSSSDAGKALLNGFTISGANGEYNDDITVNGNPIYQCSGAGIYNSISSPSYENLLVIGNYNTESGGGMFSYQSSPTLRNIIFKNNKAKDGGAIASQDNSNPILINVALIGNTATNIGGAIYNVTNSSPTFVNSTVANNSDTNGSNGMHNADTSNPNIHNCIVWGGITGSYQAQNSIIEGNDDDTNGNIDATDISVSDIFNAPTNGDYSLKEGSFVVVNKGDNTLYTNVNGNLTLVDDVDLAGNARLFDGCPTVDKIDMGAYELQEGSPVLSASATATPVSCNGGNNGTADLTVTGGIAPYSFEWSNTATTEDLTGLTAGTYSVTITDANGCTATTSAEVSEPTVLSASITATPVSCNGGNNGTADLTVTGGIAPYSFEWSNTATTEDLTGLTAGTYSVTVTDANGCTVTTSAEVSEPTVLSASIVTTPVSCNGGNNGTADLTVTGGIAPYSFEWSNTATSEDLTGLTAGTYSVTITDANGCTVTTSAEVSEPTVLSASIVTIPVSCNGGNNGTADLTVIGGIAPYNFEWSNDATTEDMIGLTAGTYSVTITDSNGCTATTSAEVNEPTVLSASIVTTPVSCNGGNNGTIDLTVTGGIAPYSFEWSNTATTEDLTGLTAGTYSVTITDANGCTTTTSAEVNEPTVLSASIVTTPVSCNGGNNGTVDLTVTGGIAPYNFEWTNDATTEDLTGLTAGTYSVTITDANGCTATTSAEVSEPTALSASIVTTPVSCNGGNNGTIDLTVTGGVAPYNFEWSNDATTEDMVGLTAGTYSVTVTDANGCTATASVAIVVEDSTKPTVVCQDITVQLDTNGNVSITADDIDNGSSDNCGIASMSISQNTFNNTNLGDNMVTLTVEDAAGNTDICTAIVTVNEAPSTIPDIAAIKIGSVSFDNPPNTINYLMDCNNGATSIEIEVLAKANTTVIPRNLFTIETPKPGIYRQTITVTPQNGNSSKTYEIVINKQFDFDGIVIQKFNNTLLVNNNPESNGGYKFVNYQWYKNEVAIGTGQYYSIGPNREDSLDPNASYSVEMTTEDGDVLSTCTGSIEHTQSYNISVTPNPVTAGSYVEVYADLPPNDLKGMQLSLHSLSGQYIKKMETQQQLTNFIIPTGTQTGVYVFYCKTTTGMVKHFKIIVK